MALWAGQASWMVLIFVGLIILVGFAGTQAMDFFAPSHKGDDYQDILSRLDQLETKVDYIRKALEE